MSKIAWFHLNVLPEMHLLPLFFERINERIINCDEIAFFFTGNIKLEDIQRLRTILDSFPIKKLAIFIALGEEHTNYSVDPEFNHGIPIAQLDDVCNNYGSTIFSIDTSFASDFRSPHTDKYFNLWNGFFSETDFKHENTIHYYRQTDSINALYINTTISHDSCTYIVDSNSIRRLFELDKDSPTRLRIALGRNSIDKMHYHDRDDFNSMLSTKPNWFFYLCCSQSKNNSINNVILTHSESERIDPNHYFYEIKLPSCNIPPYIAGYYDTEEQIGKIELYQYENECKNWVSDRNFAHGNNNSTHFGTLYYPTYSSNIIVTHIIDEISGIAEKLMSCNPDERLYSYYLRLNNHEMFDNYSNQLIDLIKYQITRKPLNLIPNSNSRFKFVVLPYTGYNQYPPLTEFPEDLERIIIIVCTYNNYHPDTFSPWICELNEKCSNAWIRILYLYRCDLPPTSRDNNSQMISGNFLHDASILSMTYGRICTPQSAKYVDNIIEYNSLISNILTLTLNNNVDINNVINLISENLKQLANINLDMQKENHSQSPNNKNKEDRGVDFGK